MPKGVHNSFRGPAWSPPAPVDADDCLALLVARAALDADAGTCEAPRGSNRGASIAKFFAADFYTPVGKDEGYPWCASAVSYWVQKWLTDNGPAGEVTRALFGAIKPPRTASAFGLIDWARAQTNVQIISPGLLAGVTRAMPGDVAVFNFSHCGIVSVGARDAGHFTCIEGNTDSLGSREGWQVARRLRGPASIKALLRMIPRPL